ncbi:MAG: tetratricopeptide repeat protein [Nitrospirae bacterium]|nr:tetratricopeptide repeat protein [Nitrospirota bacterium]MBI3352506.1 tetratricopeptide repeat protein [Nitrospirota bacterium]
MFFFRHFKSSRTHLLGWSALVLFIGLPACEKHPSAENITSSSSPDFPNSSDSDGAISEPNHPGTGVMGQINVYKDRLKENPKDLEALIFLGNSNFDIKRFEKAKALYLQALSIDPKNPSVRTDLATCFRNLKQPDQAVAELRTVLALTPGHPPALFNLGVILLNDSGDKEGAIEAWQQLLETHPKHELARGLAEKINQLKSTGALSEK